METEPFNDKPIQDFLDASGVMLEDEVFDPNIVIKAREAENIFYREYPKTPTEEYLETAEIIDETLIISGCTDVQKIIFSQEESAIFKPQAKEKLYKEQEFYPGDYLARDRLAYFVDRAIGVGLIPPTVIREYKGQIGSAQAFVNGQEYSKLSVFLEHKGKYDELAEINKRNKDNFIQLWLLDYILWNRDRHSRNMLIEEDSIHAIDNSLSFNTNRPSSYFKEYYGEVIPVDFRNKIIKFSQDEAGINVLEETLSHMFGYEGSLCLKRINRLASIFKTADQVDINKHGTLNT